MSVSILTRFAYCCVSFEMSTTIELIRRRGKKTKQTLVSYQIASHRYRCLIKESRSSCYTVYMLVSLLLRLMTVKLNNLRFCCLFVLLTCCRASAAANWCPDMNETCRVPLPPISIVHQGPASFAEESIRPDGSRGTDDCSQVSNGRRWFAHERGRRGRSHGLDALRWPH